MIVSPDILRREMVKLLTAIEAQIKEVETEAEKMGIPPEKLRDHYGNWVMVPLLCARVQAISALVDINKRGSIR